MSMLKRAAPFLTFGILIFGGCQDEMLVPSQPGADDETPGLTDPSLFSFREEVRAHEAAFHLISQEVKGFGGYYYDEEGNLVAYLTGDADEGSARRVLEQVLLKRDLAERERRGGIVIRKAEFAFTDLAAWRDRATDAVLEVPGVEWTDLDEAQNRFVVGISTPAARDGTVKVLAEHRVPEHAVLFEETGRIEEDLSLKDYKRPIEGGFQIQRGDGGTCTLGFNAYRAGKPVFLTNSHCTASVWANNGTAIYQNDTAPSSNLIGYEAHDPAPWKCGIFGIYRCRWSDAAVISRNSGVSWDFGRIARTTFWGTPGNTGSLTVSGTSPHLTIIGEYSFPTGGEMFDKVGRTTGWTYGFVKKTCVDMNKPSYTGGGVGRILCQDWTNYKSDSGDSGSPVFRWYGNTVRLAGIHWGGITQGGTRYAILSAMWNIEKDLGALSTF